MFLTDIGSMKSKIHILIIDDDKYFRVALKNLLEEEAIFTEAESEAQARELIETNFFDMALIDMDIDGPRSGINILQYTQTKKIHSIMLSSCSDDAKIEEAYTQGCDHFLAKIHYKEHLTPYVHKYKKNLFGNSTETFFKEKFLTTDEELKKNVKELCDISLKDKTVLITGETGVGKSLIGELLHEQNFDDSAPFVHINCSEITENLLESEFFGHTKGSFTGAVEDKTGKLELASGGTLFLDEIATMSLSMQKKLLKAIETKSFYPIGSNKEVKVNFTLITATCEDLFAKIAKDEFRKDFFFRISGINLHIPPLRERTSDIPLLVKSFLNKNPRKVIIKQEALEKLQTQSWNGNIRELKKAIEYLGHKEKGIIDANDINLNLNTSNGDSRNNDDYLTPEQKEYIANYGLRNFIKNIEEQSISETLKKHQGKITHAIKELKISSSAFYRIFDTIKASS